MVMLVGALKAVCSAPQSSAVPSSRMVGLGLGLEPGNGFFTSFFPVLKVTNTFVLRVSGNCDVRGIRTTTVCDVTMMYCQERYMENVPKMYPCSWDSAHLFVLQAMESWAGVLRTRLVRWYQALLKSGPHFQYVAHFLISKPFMSY